MTHPGKTIHFCPKCGNKHFPFDGHKSFKCQQCGFHFFINTAAAVAAIIENESGQILLTTRAFEPNKGLLDLPGGFVDPLESAENAVIREIKEELNLDVASTKYIISFPNEYIFSDYTVFTTDLGFLVKVKDFNSITSMDDISDYQFISPKDIDYSKICAPSIVKIIQHYISNNRKEEQSSFTN